MSEVIAVTLTNTAAYDTGERLGREVVDCSIRVDVRLSAAARSLVEAIGLDVAADVELLALDPEMTTTLLEDVVERVVDADGRLSNEDDETIHRMMTEYVDAVASAVGVEFEP